jgi:hypothetical protein
MTDKIEGELYNLREDLSEQSNLYEENPEKADELLGKLKKISNEN